MNKLTLKSGYDQSELVIEFDCDSNTNKMITIFKTISAFLTYWTDYLKYDDSLDV